MAPPSLRDVFLTCLCIVLTTIGVSYFEISLTGISHTVRIPRNGAMLQPTYTRWGEESNGISYRETQAFNTTRPLSAIDFDIKDITHRVAVVSMSKYSSSKFVLPRIIRCDGDKGNYSVLIERVSQSNIANADVVIFSGTVPSESTWIELQRRRRMRQVWLLSTEESPWVARDRIPPPHLSYIRFNISATYQPSADISVPYGIYSPFNETGTPVIRQSVGSVYSEKSMLMLWVSSHCLTMMWHRSTFVNDLSSLIPGGIDTFGACGELTCELRDFKKCREVFRRYKFVAAMENSCCGGYITEKFWNTLNKFEAVPVVVGAPKSDYEKLAPPNSFIHADDFDSMKELADYIVEVSKNKTMYDSYFEWRSKGMVHQNRIVEDMLALSDVGVCRTLDALGRGVSGNSSDFDPYGPGWLGGCNHCGDHSWIAEYSNYV